ncbi:Hypothetical predicted protein [Mytilus galloprovincialis]|uniref:Uncharacterized protein n=1 Tax=Mytilus galloprovincialis TaxID=29158 RepID=A0A8B6BW34_MYTGA|nr:Hypothetical predicted protein [Mytilus galloprovincialis]
MENQEEPFFLKIVFYYLQFLYSLLKSLRQCHTFGILTDEEQLLTFKAITMPNSPSSCGKFRIHPREGTKVLEVTVYDILNPGNAFPNMHTAPFHSQFINQWGNLQAETFSVKPNEIIKIKSVTINPQFQNPNQNSFNFNVNIKTQSGSFTVNQPMHARASRLVDRSGYAEEDTVVMDVIFEGRACKLPIDKIIPQNEMLVMTINPNVTNHNLRMWGQNQQAIKTFPPTYKHMINGMMYQHKLSDQTTLYLSLTGGHLVESFEVLEIC